MHGIEKGDGDLLAEFAATREEAPFAELVRRHGPSVLGVCHRVLGARADAEDAAQAVFLTLAQKAASLRHVNSLSAWLHHVACCVARDARKAAQRRAEHEREAAEMREPAEKPSPEGERLRAALDGEVDALPEKFRHPILLHHFEGRTHEEAAALLGCTPSAFSMRLTRGRELLRERLARRGAVFPAGLLATQLGEHVSVETVSAAFVGTTAKAASLLAAGNAAAGVLVSVHVTTLTQGALHMLFLAKMKIAAVVALATFLGSGIGIVAYRVVAEEKPIPTATGATSVASHEEAPGKNMAAELVDSARLGTAAVVLRVKRTGQTQYYYGAIWAEVKVLRIFKNEGPAIGKTLKVAWQSTDRGVPDAECTVYLEIPKKRGEPWQLVGWQAATGVSHVAAEVAETRAKPSVPVVKDGLSVAVAPAKAVFGEKEALKFAVTFKNVSEESFFLYDIQHIRSAYSPYSYAFERTGTGEKFGALFGIEDERIISAKNSKLLKPQQAFEVNLNLEGIQVRAHQVFTPGKYRLIVTVKLAENSARGTWDRPHWKGEIAADPVEFEIAADKSVGPKTSEPVAKDGLFVSLRPAKAVFTDKEPVTFVVVFKNISGKPLALNCGIRNLVTLDPYDLAIESVETGKQWKEGTGLDGMPPEKWSMPLTLAAGQTAERELQNLLPLKWLPIPPKADSAEALKPGKYRVTVKIKLAKQPFMDAGPGVWTGEISTNPAEFEISANGSTPGDAWVDVSVLFFSGRPDPKWKITSAEDIQEIRKLLKDLPPVAGNPEGDPKKPWQPQFGYRGYILSGKNVPELPESPWRLEVYNGLIRTHPLAWFKDAHGLEAWLKDKCKFADEKKAGGPASQISRERAREIALAEATKHFPKWKDHHNAKYGDVIRKIELVDGKTWCLLFCADNGLSALGADIEIDLNTGEIVSFKVKEGA